VGLDVFAKAHRSLSSYRPFSKVKGESIFLLVFGKKIFLASLTFENFRAGVGLPTGANGVIEVATTPSHRQV
jgi:hypothetical protein